MSAIIGQTCGVSFIVFNLQFFINILIESVESVGTLHKLKKLIA